MANARGRRDSRKGEINMRRRAFITLLSGAAAWPLAARAQQPTPIVGFVSLGSPAASAPRVAAFQKGLSETGHVESQKRDGRVLLA